MTRSNLSIMSPKKILTKNDERQAVEAVETVEAAPGLVYLAGLPQAPLTLISGIGPVEVADNGSGDGGNGQAPEYARMMKVYGTHPLPLRVKAWRMKAWRMKDLSYIIVRTVYTVVQL